MLMSSTDSPFGSKSRSLRVAVSARRLWGLMLLTAVSLSTLTAPGRAHADETSDSATQGDTKERVAESEQLALKGFEAYKAGEYETAIELYNQASAAHPAAALYFNVARIYDTKLSQPEKALVYYRKALAAPDVTETLVDKSLARVRVLTALLAESQESDEPAETPENTPKTDEQRPAEDKHQAQRGAPTEPDERPISKRSTQKTIGYAVGITGLVAAGAGLGLGGFALLERDKARETCDGNQCTTKGGVDSMNAAYDFATASTITMAAGGALAVVGFGMVLFAPRAEPAGQDSSRVTEPTGRAPVQLAIVPTAGGAGLQVAGAFF